MEGKTCKVTVYPCPFCPTPTWFNHPHDLAAHIKREHELQPLTRDIKKRQVARINSKWRLKT
jgi:hypothetical protein